MEKKISVLKQRILQHIEIMGVSKRNFYIKTGLPNGLLDKESGLTEDSIEKYLHAYPDINPLWFITGKGSMFKNTVLDYEENVINEPIEPYGLKDHDDELRRAQKKIIELQDQIISILSEERTNSVKKAIASNKDAKTG